MKNIKSLIVSLCLAIALTVSGAYVTKVYADGDPQGPPTSPQPGPQPGDPNHCALCYILWWLS